MFSYKNIPYYLTAVAIFILLKYAYSIADNEDLSFLLYPTDKLVGLLTDSHSVSLADNGFYHNKLNILIDKSCSGFNFWLLSFLVFTYLSLKYLGMHIYKIISIPAALLWAYLLTIFVNTARIFVSLIVQNHTRLYFACHQNIIHEAVGVITNLSFLVLVYYLIEKLLIYRQQDAKLS